jgi:asparagine synthase (glutamine-hydrolysing)
MCGIAGIYQPFKQKSKNISILAKKMAGIMAHRGPDDSGTWSDTEGTVALSHSRLSIIDLSPEGHQPMISSSGRYVISFNGEIYNFLDLYHQLKDLGHGFRGRSDTEVMLEAIDQWGINYALQKFNGMFAFALWDNKNHELHLVRDRLGKKPLYAGWAGSTLVFASELKALRAHPDFCPEVNRSSLTLYMRYACIPAPFTIYQGIWTIPAGCRLTVTQGNINEKEDISAKMEPYWHHARVLEEARTKTRAGNEARVLEEFEELLSRCVRDRMISDVPLGAFLSGGIDSSAVVALIQKESAQAVKTYTVGFHEAGFDEAGYARKIASHLGTEHHELYLSSKEALEVVPMLPDIYDEPFADISAIPTYLISKFAREEVTVALSGDGGDEMFGGYNRHFAGPLLWQRMKLMPLPLRKWLSLRIKSLPVSRWDKLGGSYPQLGERLYKAAAVLPLKTPEDIYRRLLSQHDDPLELVVDGSEPKIPLYNNENRPQTNLSFAEMMMAGDALSYLPNDILIKMDRASMAVSLEARAPFLDQRIYEYSWSLPESLKIRDGRGKWILRQLLKKYLPEDLYERPKQGFNMPVGAWLREDLREWAGDLLSEEKIGREGFLRPAQVRTLWQEHQNGEGNHAAILWAILMFQSWLERWGRV